MKPPRSKASRVLLAALVLLLAGLAVVLAWVWFVPPEAYEPALPAEISPFDAQMNDLVGWYQDREGGTRFITWAARGGYSYNRFDDIAQSFLWPVERNLLEWRKGEDNPSIRVVRNEAKRIEELEIEAGEDWRPWATRLSGGPYRQEEVRFPNGEVELTGVLLLPNRPDRVPGVVFIHGSGVSDRDNFWYLYQADYLARRGIAVLLPDKRGCGRSGGEWHTAGFEDFAGDAIAAGKALAFVPGVDPERVGLLGISQGGWIAPLAASMNPNARFVVNVSGSATTPRRQLRHEIRADLRERGAPGIIANLLEPFFSRRAMGRRAVWWEKNASFDPIPHWKRLTCPVLVIYGRLDEEDNVPVQESLELLEPISSAAPEGMWTYQVYDDIGHAMIDPVSSWIREAYLERMADWILTAASP